jgi:glycosyltransferase involved in cell wall biosynthesis
MDGRVQAIRSRLNKKIAARAVKGGPKTICLVMIVRNESRIITRCLDSLIGIIDCLSVVDTGSTDDTPAVIKEWCTAHSIEGIVHTELFRNFGYNRTHSVTRAQQHFKTVDYFLLSDADFVWENTGLNKSLLFEDCYGVLQYEGAYYYWNIRMLKASEQWVCRGATHEYWDKTKGNNVMTQMYTLRIDDRADGGSKSDKFERDVRLITKALEEKLPSIDRSRYIFYLAQSYYALGEYAKALVHYADRVKRKGNSDEVYYSYYRAGLCYEALGWKVKDTKSQCSAPDLDVSPTEDTLFDQAIEQYQQAWGVDLHRGEALYSAVKLYRCLGKYQLAYDLAIQGRKLSLPVNGFCIDSAVYLYLFDYEISIVAFYIDKREEGAAACVTLLASDDLPPEVRESVEKNSRHYV